jgi:hypothetical protein
MQPMRRALILSQGRTLDHIEGDTGRTINRNGLLKSALALTMMM